MANLPEGSVVFFTDYKGIRLYRLPENDATPIGKALSQRFFDTISGKAEEGFSDWKSPDGVIRIMAFKQLRLKENLPPYMYIIVGLPKELILQKANMDMLENTERSLGLPPYWQCLWHGSSGIWSSLSPLIGWSRPLSNFGMGKMAHVRACPQPR